MLHNLFVNFYFLILGWLILLIWMHLKSARGKNPDICVHVKQMQCPAKFLELFDLMYETIEQEDDHIIFREAS